MPDTTTLTTGTRTAAERTAILADPGFGEHFSDHMATAIWSSGRGWTDCQVGPLQPFSMHPGSGVLHYGQEIFEGLKAYRHADGSLNLFRPERNAARFARSARRLALPELPPAMFLGSVTQLVLADAEWVPAYGSEASLYLRPIEFASESFLGVRPATKATFCVIGSPVGPYFAGGVRGIKLWVTTKYSRASPGGTGDIKCGGNYAGSLLAQTEARELGCDQVLYTSGPPERRVVDEAGTMNLMAVTADGELLTPNLGMILEGVTRGSLLDLAGDHGLVPVEREIPLAELIDRVRRGTITEVFAAGTAAVITPITALAGEGFDLVVGDGTPGPKALELREHLLGIQHGDLSDPRGWVHRIG